MARDGINRRELDKWARNLNKEMNRSLQKAARQDPARLPVHVSTSTSGSGNMDSGTMSPQLTLFLLWLDAHSQQGGYTNPAAYSEDGDVPSEEVALLALQLEQQGLVNVLRTYGSDAYPLRLNDEGRVTAHRLKELQKNRTERLRHTINAFLRWLHNSADESVPTDPSLFLTDPVSLFAGSKVSAAEMGKAIGYLEEHELVETPDADPATVVITAQGINCVLSGKSVQDHLNQRPGDQVTINVGENTGNIAANSREFTMNATTSKDGINPTAVVMLARALRQAAPMLELPEDDALEFTQLATRLENEAATGSPDSARLKRWGGNIISILSSPVARGALCTILAEYTETTLPGLSSS
ncbi:hypothetical protein ACLMNJ_29020 [Streptomyces seoulensis]